MISTEALTRLREAMHQISAQEGAFVLFGVFMRSEPAGACDLVVAAPWLERGKLKAVGELNQLLSQHAGDDILSQFSSIQVVEDGNPALDAVLSAVHVDDGEVRIQRSNFFGLEIEDAVIFRASRAA